jgi:predicted MFS family arabinose efflux permease
MPAPQNEAGQAEACKRLFWVYALSAAVYFNQGIEGLPSQGLFYYLKETLKFSPEKIMLLTSIVTFAWLVKPLIGYAVDNFLSKKLWICFSLIFNSAIVMTIALLNLPLAALVAVLLLNSTGAAFRDVAADGIMCVEGKNYNSTGKIQSVQWIALSVSGLITGILGGYIAQKWDYKIGFLWLIPFYLTALAITCFYRQSPQLEGEGHKNYALADLKNLFLNKQLMFAAFFIFLYQFSPSFGTPLFFIQRDTFGWGKIWIGTLGTIGMIFRIIGAVFYYKFSQRINIKKWIYVSVFVGATTTLSYLYYTPLTAVIYEIIYSFIGMFIFIMLLDLMARKTAKGFEATSFALLCSFSNLALTASNISGALLLPKLGLKWLIIISSLTSFLCLFLIKEIHEPEKKIPLS